MSSSQVSIKLVHHTETIRLPFTTPVTLGAIKITVERQWPALGASNFDLGYDDDTSERIRLSGDEGVEEALQHHSGPVLKIFVTPKAATEPTLSSLASAATAPTVAAVATAPAPPGMVHLHVSCDGCGASPVIGARFKCAFCSNYDLCGGCHARNVADAGSVHEVSHPWVLYEASDAPGVHMPPTAAATHSGIACDGCGVAPISGTRWKCAVCEDYDLCGDCEARNGALESLGAVHAPTHPFLKIGTVGQAPAAIVAVVREDHERGGGAGEGGARSRGGHSPRHHSGAPHHGGGGWHRSGCHGAGGATALHPHHHHHGRGGGWRGVRGGGGGGSWRVAATADSAASSSAPPGGAAAAAPAAAPAPVVGPESESAMEESRLLAVALAESMEERDGLVSPEPSSAAAAAADASSVCSDGGASETDAPEASIAAVPAPAPAAPAPPPLSAAFIAHLNHAEGATVAPCASVTKTWRLANDGSAAWPAGTTLVRVSGHDLGGASVAVPVTLPGASVDVSVQLVAPAPPGAYTAIFRLEAPLEAGQPERFGERVLASVFVSAPAVAPLAAPAPAAAAPATIVSDGGATVSPECVIAAGGNANAAAVFAALASASAPSAAAAAPPRWPLEMAALESMGFIDAAANAAALERHNGNASAAVGDLVHV